MSASTEGLEQCECANRVPAYGRLVASNGARHIIQYCESCGGRISSQSVKRWTVEEEGYVVDELPIVVDYRGDGPECEVAGCTSTNTEHHHWAPRHLFGDDACLWPSSYLCREKHHPEWHLVVTPDMAPAATEPPDPLEGFEL